MADDVTLQSKFLIRRDTEANWQSANPVLEEGELGVATDTFVVKVGNGISTWNQLVPINKTEFTKVHVADKQPTNLKNGELWIEIQNKE